MLPATVLIDDNKDVWVINRYASGDAGPRYDIRRTNGDMVPMGKTYDQVKAECGPLLAEFYMQPGSASVYADHNGTVILISNDV